MITSMTIVNHEMIGLYTTIVESANRQIVGLSGKIVDETKSTFVLETVNGIKMIPKEHSNWKFICDGKLVVVKGSSILKRSYERMGVKP